MLPVLHRDSSGLGSSFTLHVLFVLFILFLFVIKALLSSSLHLKDAAVCSQNEKGLHFCEDILI